MRIMLEFQLIPSGRNGEMVCWTQNCPRIFKLSKSVNGKGTIPAQSTCHMASIQLSQGEEGWEKFEAAKIEWQVASIPSANCQEYVKTRLHVST